MLDWLLTSIDASRTHGLTFEASWHARLMVLAWSFLVPIGVLFARFFKITKKQKWPQELDNRIWWYTHLFFQYCAGVAVIVAMALIWNSQGSSSVLHQIFGWATVTLCAIQFLAGWLRGSKGGPTEIERTGTIRGDHYDMTRRRQIFEHLHKSTGYVCLLISLCATFSGLWATNAPHWMWIVLVLWWGAIIVYFAMMQKRGNTIDTYQALWGPDPDLIGNKMTPIGYGIRRKEKGE